MKLSPEQYERIIAATEAGQSHSEVAEIVGCTKRTVARVRQRAGLSHPPAPRITAAELARMHELLDDGASYAEVAATVGRSPVAVRRCCPGRGWNQEQVTEHLRTVRRFKPVSQVGVA
ncbi:helix-turn-helix DNA binding protein [Mycobacterium phage MalagasyRose]|uniref:Helix-turn-helix DNA binding protein n=1 Tax=Mycobacterium phage MalagasyRose TaxID=2599870 RepID=A0A5J6TDC3_9CAUD|nr:helix-turn-helix DNA binding protein [Mycobacterium phage MalagasyRose]QFG08913.1 helix-turn-helix DNA binding protein [Mycobacterium phage MalagasyRose]